MTEISHEEGVSVCSGWRAQAFALEGISIMLTTFGLLMALSFTPGDAGQLSLTDVRTTYGILGARRPNDKFLPGDLFVLSFDIEGTKANASGKIRYGIGLEVSDANGKVLYKQDPVDSETASPADGKLAAFARLEIGTEQPSGNYMLKVSVTDRTAGVTQEVTRPCQVLPPAFGIVRPSATSDPDGKTPIASLHKGKPGWIHFAAVGFARDGSKGQPHLTATLNVLDEAAKPALAKPSSGTIAQDVPRGAKAVPMQFALVLQKAGKYTAELVVTDDVSGKKATLSLPIRVEESK
jgi:hypothetical protein